MEVTIREASEDDLGQILAIYQNSGIDSAADSLSVEEARHIFGKMKSYPNYKVFVTEDSGQIVGTFALIIMDNLGHRGAPSGVVEDVAVMHSYQGRGVGKAMMKFALASCAEFGCYKMALSSNETRIEAHKFYESLGFTRHGFSFKADLNSR